MQNRRLYDMNIPFTLIWRIFSASNRGSGSSLDKPLSSWTSNASIVSSRYMRHALSSADKCSILSSLCTTTKRDCETYYRYENNWTVSSTIFVLYLTLNMAMWGRPGTIGQSCLVFSCKEITNYTTPVLSSAIFHSILACQENLFQMTPGACEQLEIISLWSPLKKTLNKTLRRPLFVLHLKQIHFLLSRLIWTSHIDCKYSCSNHYNPMHKFQFFISPFEEQTEALSKVISTINLTRHEDKCTRSVSMCYTTKQISNRVQKRNLVRHSHSQSSCWLHCHSSRHCPFYSRSPRQRRLATCHSSALHKEEEEDRTRALRSAFNCVNITKNQSEEESERSRRRPNWNQMFGTAIFTLHVYFTYIIKYKVSTTTGKHDMEPLVWG